MELRNIYNPIQKELDKVDKILLETFRGAENGSIRKMADYLLESPGKRIRPALVILSAKAVLNPKSSAISPQLIKIASAIELIHTASLIHDDVIDRCAVRHHKPTINAQWGQDVSIVLGDYLYSIAFKLISACENMDILNCISSATETLCEGELIQVAERNNLSLSKERYIVIVKKKTASLFAASCEVGAMVAGCPRRLRDALKQYGLNFGIAFQIIDDYLDIMSSQRRLGKPVGLDIRVGELTLPLLYFADHNHLSFQKAFLKAQGNKKKIGSLKKLLISSGACEKTRGDILDYSLKAKDNLNVFKDSEFKQSLLGLVDFIQEKTG